MGLGELIRQRRRELNLTQHQVAERVGISKPYLSTIENDKVANPPTDGVLERLEGVLGFPEGELRKLAHLARTPADIRDEHEKLTAEVEKLRGLLRKLPAGKARRGKTKTKATARQFAGGGDNIGGATSAGRAIPVINRIAAGYPNDFTDLDYPPSVADEYVHCPDIHDPQAFAARVVGDSMEPRYHEGDIVIFSPNTPAREGDDCFVRFSKDNSTTFKRFSPAGGGRICLRPLNSKYKVEQYDPEEINGLWPAVMRVERLREP